MNKYELLEISKDKIITEEYDSIVEAICDYKALCSYSTLSNVTIQLKRNGVTIHEATFVDYEEN